MNQSLEGHPLATYREGCERGQVRYQRCRACGHVQVYPRTTCGACRAADLEWLTSQRSGTLDAWTVVHRAASPRFQARVPYVLALVDMTEGFRLMLNIADDGPLAIGDRVTVDLVDIDGEQRPHGRIVR